MTRMNLRRVIAGLAAVLLAGVVIGSAAAADRQITARGIGGVRLGKTYRALHAQHLVGRIHHGCELGGPETRSAALRAPLQGTADFTLHAPRKVANVTVTGGATARGVGIGASLADVTAAFPKARVDHTTEATFAITLVKVPASGGGRLQFAIDTATKKVSLIGIPFIAFCE
jgi:hypothetical protein